MAVPGDQPVGGWIEVLFYNNIETMWDKQKSGERTHYVAWRYIRAYYSAHLIDLLVLLCGQEAIPSVSDRRERSVRSTYLLGRICSRYSTSPVDLWKTWYLAHTNFHWIFRSESTDVPIVCVLKCFWCWRMKLNKKHKTGMLRWMRTHNCKKSEEDIPWLPLAEGDNLLRG